MSVSTETRTERDVVLPLTAAAGDWAAEMWQRVEPLLVRASDHLNPILVKETRQALKSSQFTVTFVLVLVACWVVTMGGVALIGPSIFYSAAGGAMLFAYYIILAFPLLAIVPIAAYRSLAAEREDNTYDLLSITTLKSRQIISGKLGSSIVQMMVYFSAITPCLAFTYLLRGVDVPTIAVLLVYTFFGSLGLCMAGLLLATLSRHRFGQVFILVAFVAGLLLIGAFALWLAFSLIFFGYAVVTDDGFWTFSLVLSTLYATTFALAFFAAAAMITFSSENRSTPLRICMVLQQAAFVGWIGYAWITDDFSNSAILALGTIAVLYWYVMGTMLTAEQSEMSQRVKRRLPSSTVGRVFLTWLNPGPATGYLFVVANATAVVAVSLAGIAVAEVAGKGGGWLSSDELLLLLVIGWGYLVAYLGLGLLIVTGLRRVAVVTMLACVLIHFLLVLAGSGIPTAFKLMSVDLRNVDYSFIQIANPYSSLYWVANGGASSDGLVLIVVVPAAAVCMLLLNLRAVVQELRQVRVAPPPRVLEDERELHPPPTPRPQSPWDVAN